MRRCRGTARSTPTAMGSVMIAPILLKLAAVFGRNEVRTDFVVPQAVTAQHWPFPRLLRLPADLPTLPA